MSPKYISIPGIDLKPTEQLTIKPNVKKTNTTILSTGFDLGFKLVNNTGRNALIKQIILPIKEIRNSNYYLKLDFYELTDNKNDITSKKINGDSQFIPVASLQSGNNAISLDEKIALPKEGVLLSMRIIENIGKYSDRVTNPVIVFYHDKVFGNTYFYNSKHIWEEFKSNPKIAIGLVLLQ
ncbi:hypothetical protein [Chryseobacterium sp. FH2]|uniref:hypothetical protein n=1 Tax=Chryseobacterium sp. FH2 TaxID=1674291 RepID=UPI00103C2F03|nr:hypothetical protein [Chryseobacterium sp. FH2]